MRSPEGIEKDKIDKYLKTTGAWFCKPATFGFGASGVPDIVGCYLVPTYGEAYGRFFSIEVKREGKYPTPVQERRLKEIRKAGGLGFWGTAEKVIPELIAHGILAR